MYFTLLFQKNPRKGPASDVEKKVVHGTVLPYLTELDALRTLAVVMTLLAHFSPVEIPYMWYGVQIFFTISGFLITANLLKSLNKDPDGPKLPIIKNFMIRRALRLFPVYYLFIIIFWLAKRYLSLYLWQDEFTPYFFTYTPNFFVYRSGSGAAGCFAHLWSLGVEEQFYLLWPWIILFSTGKFRIQIISGMMAFSLVYIFMHYDNTNIGALPFVNFHTLGTGALLAVFYVQSGTVIDWLREKRFSLFLVTFIQLLVVLCLFRDSSPLWHLWREISLCCCTFSIVLTSIFGWKGWMGYIMRNKQMQYIGTISYGIYLYHMPVPYVFRAVADKLSPGWHIAPLWFLFLCMGITIVIAAVSYRFIETPFLKLKRYFA